MSEYRETRRIVEDVPIKRARPVEMQRDAVVYESRGMSGGAIAALVLAALAVGVLITMLLLNNQQRISDDELAQERARTAAAQQAAAQPPQQPIVVTPQSQPGMTPTPAPSQPAPASAPPTATPTSAEVELDITSRLLGDEGLRPHTIDVKVIGGSVMLSGTVPTVELKDRAEKLARTVKGVRSITNNIEVKPE